MTNKKKLRKNAHIDVFFLVEMIDFDIKLLFLYTLQNYVLAIQNFFKSIRVKTYFKFFLGIFNS